MSREADFAAAVAKHYEQSGWMIVSPEDAVEHIDFRPDLLLRKGDRHLVVEIKEEGFSGSRAIDIIKKMVELDNKWSFEVKVIPREWGIQESEAGEAVVGARVHIAERLRAEGHASEAFILFWTVVEATLRLLLGIDAKRIVDSSTLIREAYEEGVIVDADLRELQAALHIRNRLVHGLRVETDGNSDASIADLAKSLFGRVRSSPTIAA